MRRVVVIASAAGSGEHDVRADPCGTPGRAVRRARCDPLATGLAQTKARTTNAAASHRLGSAGVVSHRREEQRTPWSAGKHRPTRRRGGAYLKGARDPARLPTRQALPAAYWVALDYNYRGVDRRGFETEEGAQAAAEQLRSNPPPSEVVTINTVQIERGRAGRLSDRRSSVSNSGTRLRSCTPARCRDVSRTRSRS